MLSWFTEITVRRSISMFPSWSSNRVDFLPYSVMSNFPLSKTLDARKNWVTRFCNHLEYHHCCSFVPLSVWFYQHKSCTKSFPIQVPGKTNDRDGTWEHTSQLQQNSDYILLYCRFPPHIISSNMDMKMILPLECSGSYCVHFMNFCESLRGCLSWWILGRFSARIPSACHRCDSIPWDSCSANTI